MKFRIGLLIIMSSVLGCARFHRNAVIVRDPVISPDRQWAYQEYDTDKYVVVVANPRDRKSLELVLKKIGCGPCAVAYDGENEVLLVEKLHTKK